jgi:hypothetical protein
VTAAAKLAGLRWLLSVTPRSCEECAEPILYGERMAIYDDVALESWGKRTHTMRHYCESCGHLLEDSLTTTGDD